MRSPPPEAAGGPPEAGLLLGLLDADRPEDPAPAWPGEGEDVQEPGGGGAMNEGEIALATQLADSVKEFFQDDDDDDALVLSEVDAVVVFADGEAKLVWEFEDDDDEEGGE